MDSCELSPEDRALFRQIVGDVKKIHSDRVELPPLRRLVKICRVPEPLPYDFVDMMSDELSWTDLDPDALMTYLKAGYDHQLLKRIEQGKIKVSHIIDLHGLTIVKSREMLNSFLKVSFYRGDRFVKIIHGQGYNSAGGPVLRSKVNQWLRLRSEVLAFANPPQHMGGKGATVCILKRCS